MGINIPINFFKIFKMLKDTKNNIELKHKQYINASPFPHIVLDDFFPKEIMKLVLNEIKNHDDWYTDQEGNQAGVQVNKFYTPSTDDYQFKRSMDMLEKKCPFTSTVLKYFHSREMLDFLENLTGIKDLQTDNDWLGGGIHKVNSGGKLDIHADFNIHWKQNLHRRLNLLLYLNEDWRDEYNGELELWEKDLSRCVVKIKPIFNRAVIFTITDDAYHGHPKPLNCPPEVSRIALALYYYTKDRPEIEKAPFHGAAWQKVNY